MAEKRVITGIVMDEQQSMTFIEVCDYCRISEDLLLDMIEHGLFSPLPASRVEPRMLTRILSANRLQKELGLNVPGAVLALELMDELVALRDELAILKRHIE